MLTELEKRVYHVHETTMISTEKLGDGIFLDHKIPYLRFESRFYAQRYLDEVLKPMYKDILWYIDFQITKFTPSFWSIVVQIPIGSEVTYNWNQSYSEERNMNNWDIPEG